MDSEIPLPPPSDLSSASTIASSFVAAAAAAAPSTTVSTSLAFFRNHLRLFSRPEEFGPKEMAIAALCGAATLIDSDDGKQAVLAEVKEQELQLQ
ncbi:hypothetical protein BZA05DRAFT_448093 [Tricharina praecox]|uniref:uncharacterized protein n=1 Tax=Tricharina praecox TaxID=43433 RepID=UPI00221FA534|nr:uncharacterized protein BZA05DRAFT_448093 [Tricharina praecox]KAI5844887.1 hypothetical protein BZA05DRAFT_448093 [Tricharina praecox]